MPKTQWKGTMGIRNIKHYLHDSFSVFFMPFRGKKTIKLWPILKFIFKSFIIFFAISFVSIGIYLILHFENIVNMKIIELEIRAKEKEKHLNSIVYDAWNVNVAKIEEVELKTIEMMEMIQYAYPRINLKIDEIKKIQEKRRKRILNEAKRNFKN